jgi:ribosomal 50S subunit-recycling heat shock protein
MRLDLFLKKTCVLSQRSVAKEICDAGAVQVNGVVAKASHLVDAGDRIELHLAHRDLELQVLEVPFGNVAKRDAARYVTIVRDERRDLASDGL